MFFNGVPAMKNVLWSNWGLSAVIVASIIFAMPGAGFCALQDTQNSGRLDEKSAPSSQEIELLQLKAEALAQEVNETVKDEMEKTEAVKRTRYQEELGYVPKGNLLSDDELAAFENQRAEKVRAARARLDNEVKVLQEKLPQQGRPQAVEEPYKPRPLKGTVTGIVLYEKKAAALIDGRIVRQNNVIRDIKVLRIMPDYVEFEKQGKVWIQEVGQAPPAEVWEPKEPPRAQQSAASPKGPAK